MPLPFALDHINLWLIEDGDGMAAVDTGIALDTVKSAWQSVLAGRQLTRQIVTHFHPDHLGLAAWLETTHGAPLAMTPTEYLTAQAIAAGLPPFDIDSLVMLFRRHGLDETRAAAIRARGNAYRRGVPQIPATFVPLYDGDTLHLGAHDWRVIVGRGHSPEHACLYCERLGLLIAGDMLLPRISSNVASYASTPAHDTLRQYLDALARLAELPADTLVLPAHGLPFRGIRARVEELHAHHAARCDELCAACAQAPRAAGELLEVLFGRMLDDPHQVLFAMSEAIAHLNHLVADGRLRRIVEGDVIRHTPSP